MQKKPAWSEVYTHSRQAHTPLIHHNPPKTTATMADTAPMMTEAPTPAGEPEPQQEPQHGEASVPAAMEQQGDDDGSQSQETGAAAATTNTINNNNNHNKSPEFEPPLSSVTKVIRRAVGDSVQVGKEAKATFTRAAGIFILYITACANDFSRDGKRATLTANDVYAALKELDFEDMIEPLQDFLRRSNEEKKNKIERKATLKREEAAEEGADKEVCVETRKEKEGGREG
eukprot:evm.model.NODE_7565_length_13978_cov_20.023323.5